MKKSAFSLGSSDTQTTKASRPLVNRWKWIVALSLVTVFVNGAWPLARLKADDDNKHSTTQPGRHHERDDDDDDDRAPAPAPEPATALLLGSALLVGGGILRWKRARAQKQLI